MSGLLNLTDDWKVAYTFTYNLQTLDEVIGHLEHLHGCKFKVTINPLLPETAVVSAESLQGLIEIYKGIQKRLILKDALLAEFKNKPESAQAKAVERCVIGMTPKAQDFSLLKSLNDEPK